MGNCTKASMKDKMKVRSSRLCETLITAAFTFMTVLNTQRSFVIGFLMETPSSLGGVNSLICL